MATAAKLGMIEGAPGASEFAVERHFTVQEIAELWQVSADTVRRTFAGEPGVLTIGRGRRALLRVPQSILSRVHNRMANGKRNREGR